MNLPELITKSNIKIYPVSTETELELPLFEGGVSAGFPSPAADFLDINIDLNKHLIKNPSSTFIAVTDGFSMVDSGISNKDLLVVDRSLKPKNGDIAVCVINDEFLLKQLKVDDLGNLWLMPANKSFAPIKVTEYSDFEVWGVVTFSIQKH